MNVVLLGVIAAAMFATLFLVYQTVEAEREQREQVRRTVEVLEELRQVSRSAISGETGQRGYLITLDRRYLAPYQAGREQIDPTLDRIRELIGEDATARQTELIDKIDALARAKFDEMATGVELLENGRLLDARRAILTDEGVETMERLDRAIAERRTLMFSATVPPMIRLPSHGRSADMTGFPSYLSAGWMTRSTPRIDTMASSSMNNMLISS